MIHDLPFNAVEFFRRLLSNKKGLYDNRKKLNTKLMDSTVCYQEIIKS